MTAGRLLLGAVAPEWRGQGIGLQLWRHALDRARQLGWQTITCGPCRGWIGRGCIPYTARRAGAAALCHVQLVAVVK